MNVKKRKRVNSSEKKNLKTKKYTMTGHSQLGNDVDNDLFVVYTHLFQK